MRGWLGPLAFCLIGCGPRPDPVVVPGVFRWKNDPALGPAERAALAAHGPQRVYVKVLDIDAHPTLGAAPVSTVPCPRDGLPPGTELVPSIYITERTLVRLDDAGADTLAMRLLRKLRTLCPAPVHGVMLDMDWTDRSRDRFFRLARTIADSTDVPVTATIRLHQLARPQRTGVPPVDRGLLMPYNIGRVDEPGTANSIFDRKAAEPYFRSGAYPLPLDIALPAFSWGAQFRKDRFVGLLPEDLLDDALRRGLLRGDTLGLMQVVREDNAHRPELYLGDVVRVERMTPERIARAADLARTAANTDTVAVVFFELGAPTFQRLPAPFTARTVRMFGTVRAPGAACWPAPGGCTATAARAGRTMHGMRPSCARSPSITTSLSPCWKSRTRRPLSNTWSGHGGQRMGTIHGATRTAAC